MDNINPATPINENTPPIIVEKKKSNPILVILLSLLSIGLIGLQAYQMFFEKEDIKENENTQEDTVTEEEDTEYVLKNSGWGLYEIQEYEFKTELPTYTMSQKVDDFNVSSFWKVWVSKDTSPFADFYPDYLNSVRIQFIPNDTSMFGCGGGCAKEHVISVNVFENKGSKSLNDVKDIYFANAQEDADGNMFELNLTQKEESKWGLNVITFTEHSPSDISTLNGNIVVTPKYVYVIRYYLSSTPAESKDIALKVLDSFTFGE